MIKMKTAIRIFSVLLAALFPFFTSCGSAPADRSARNAQPLNGMSDSERFALEYPSVGRNNIFVFRNAGETADILANGTGIVFIGFKECPWCQTYAVYLNETTIESGIGKIFYCDILEDRQNNTESYQRIVNILSGTLQYDNEGRPRVYVPDVTIVDGGKIICRDFETSKDTLGYETPKEYWTDERVGALKEKLYDSMSQISRSCGQCDY